MPDLSPPCECLPGDRVGDGLRSGFHDVIIVINPKKLAGYEIGTLADYVTFLALAQPHSLDDCQQLPTILNLFASSCAAADNTAGMTDSDLGYLRGLYHMTDGATLTQQKNEIAYQVGTSLLRR